MAKKTLIMDETAILRALARITHELIERNKGVQEVVLLGVKTRGVPLAEMLKSNIKINATCFNYWTRCIIKIQMFFI